MGAQHSWNSDSWYSNYFLYKLQRHSDHHENPLKWFYTLEAVPDAPTMPFGYITMFVMCFVTPLWFRIMNPLAKEVCALPFEHPSTPTPT